MIGAFAPSYPRHRILLEGLRLAGDSVTVRRLPQGSSTIKRLGLVARSLGDLRQFDAVLIPAFNQTVAPAIAAAAKVAGVPVLLDYMVGISDVDADRQTHGAVRAAIFRQLDRLNLRAIRAVTDTQAHVAAFEHLLGVKLPRLGVLPVGVEPEWLDVPSLAVPDGKLTALFIGKFIPFQGVDVIVAAAGLLRDDPRIRFELVGSGQTFAQAEAQVHDLALTNLELVQGFFPIPELTARAARAGVILGVFGATEKTQYVVPNKVYDGLAMGRAVITAESAALREFFTPGEDYFAVTPGSAEALAAALVEAVEQPERMAQIGAVAQAKIRAGFLPKQIGQAAHASMAGL